MKRLLTALACLAAALVVSATDTPPSDGSFKVVAGPQLYNLRESFKADLPLGTGVVKWAAALSLGCAKRIASSKTPSHS